MWPGTPDLSITTGWVEMKWLPAWPKVRNPEDPVLIPHYTPQQRIWHREHHKAGGSIWVMLQVGRQEVLMFTGCFAAEALGRVNREALLHGALRHWPKGYTIEELVQCLMTPTT